MKIKSAYIANPVFDNIFFIFTPLISLIIGLLISESWVVKPGSGPDDSGQPLAFIIIGSLVVAHHIIGYVRSHGNQHIFNMFPMRFTIIPVIIFIAMISSHWLLITMVVVTTWWDEWHASQQTFGLGRIYDAKAGNTPLMGRKLDMGVNFLFWMGPILAGATMLDTARIYADDFHEIGKFFFYAIPAYADSYHSIFTWAVFLVGIPFLIYYLYSYYRFYKQGYNISMQKVLLITTTAFCSIYAWGFNTFGQAFFVMSLFHYIQYFAIVWLQEKDNMIKLLGISKIPFNKYILLLVFIMLPVSLGYLLHTIEPSTDFALSFFILMAILHYWYDSFIWSVRKAMV